MLPQIICISAKRKEMALESGKVYRIPIKGLQVVEHMQSFYKVFIMPQFLQFSDVYHQQKQNEAVLLRWAESIWISFPAYTRTTLQNQIEELPEEKIFLWNQ